MSKNVLILFARLSQSYIFFKKKILFSKCCIIVSLPNGLLVWYQIRKLEVTALSRLQLFTQEEANNTVKTMTSELTGHRNRNRAVNSAQDSDCSKLEHKRHRIIYLFWSFKAFPSITSAAASGSNPTLLSLFLSFFPLELA